MSLDIKNFSAGTCFMNVYGTSLSPATQDEKKALFKLGTTKCAFCPKTISTGLSHVVQANFNTMATSRPVRLVPGCTNCNVGEDRFKELKLLRKTQVIKTKQTCKIQPMFVLSKL
jgi:hypothetical protein